MVDGVLSQHDDTEQQETHGYQPDHRHQSDHDRPGDGSLSVVERVDEGVNLVTGDNSEDEELHQSGDIHHQSC